MKKQAYQKPTIYNSDGTKAQTGTYDIRTDPLTNSTADGILDYVNNNLEALNDRIEATATALLTKLDSSNIFVKQIGQGSSFSFKLVSNGAVIIVFRGNNAQLFVVDGWTSSGYAAASIGNTLASVSQSNKGITVKNIGSAGAMMTYIFNLPAEIV